MEQQKEEGLASLLAKAPELRGNVEIWRAYCALEQEYRAQLDAIHHGFVHGGGDKSSLVVLAARSSCCT